MSQIYEIVSTIERPDLVPVVADWLWGEFWRHGGTTIEETTQLVETTLTATHMPRTFVLLIDGTPVGTASLAEDDLDTRLDLNPWLAGVFVDAAFRGAGIATHLVAAVEAEARRQGIGTLWLFTRTAERIYARLGWHTVEHFERKSNTYALMRRDLAG